MKVQDPVKWNAYQRQLEVVRKARRRLHWRQEEVDEAEKRLDELHAQVVASRKPERTQGRNQSDGERGV